MARKFQLPNKTKWALEDQVARCSTARDDLDVGIELVASANNPLLVQVIGRLYRHINYPERKAVLAMQGDYEEEERTIREKTAEIIRDAESRSQGK